MSLTENEVSMILQRLMQRGFLQITQGEDAAGVLYEAFSLQPLWNRLTDKVIEAESKEEVEERKDSRRRSFQVI